MSKLHRSTSVFVALFLVLAAWAMPASAATQVTARSAGTKLVGQATNTWGSATAAPMAKVWTEALLPTGWSRSQTRQTDARGGFVIPLTYGTNTVGTTTYRVGVAAPGGTVYSEPFKLVRTAPSVTVYASSAGTKPVHQATNTWGTAQNAPNSRAWTEVRLASGWSRSQSRTTDRNGKFVIPLTYNVHKAGPTVYRVGVQKAGRVYYSRPFTLTRVAPAKAQRVAPAKPAPTVKKPAPKAPSKVYYKNCAAVRAAGKAPLYRGQPGYARHLDRDGDGIACEWSGR